MRTLAIVFYAVICAAVLAQNPAQSELYTKHEYMIAMRDGVRLYTAVYVPKANPGKHPILLERTPYGAGPYGPDAYRGGFRGSKKFKDAGYIFAFQDVRGMGRSQGKFDNVRPQLVDPRMPQDIDESTDTYDTVEHLVRNVPDNNGRVGLWGISYPGFYAAVGAINSHPALRAVSPQAPVSNWFIGDDFHHHGAFFLMDAVRFARFGESRDVPRAPRQNINTNGDAYKFYLENFGVKALTDKYFQDTDGLWLHLLRHPDYDEYWQTRDTTHNLKNIRCAVLTVGGWFDAEDLWGALKTYEYAERQNPKTFNALVMGPWFHGMWAGPVGSQFGGIQFDQPTSTYFQDNIEFPFFDAFLRTDARVRIPDATIFFTGSNQWKVFDAWPPRTRTSYSFFLHPGGKLSSEKTAADRERPYDAFVSDPKSPVPYQGGTQANRTREYMIDDQRFATARPDVMSYQTDPLKRPLTVAGPIQADIWLSTTGTDTDLVVKLIDVFPADYKDSQGKAMGGHQMLVRAEVMRCKYHLSYQNPKPLVPDLPHKISFSIPDTAHTFRIGHRVMVQVQASWFPLVDMNPQVFTNIYTSNPSDFQKATVRIYRGGTRLSRVLLDVIPSDNPRERMVPPR